VRCAAFILALLAALTHAPQAWAHASLLKASPADGAVMARPPSSLSLTFNEPVSPLVIRLIGPDGKPILLDDVTVENETITINAPRSMDRGTHVLSWRVISADGHPVGGSVIFSIGAPSTRPAAQSVADRGVRVALWTAKLLIYAGLFIGVGGAFFRSWFADSVSRAPAACVLALAIGLIAAWLSIGLQGLDALDLPLSELRGRAVWEAGLVTSYGGTVILCVFAMIAGLLAFAAKSVRSVRAFAMVGLFATGFALAFSGHASNAAPSLVNRPTVFLHAVCAAFWIGSLLPLYIAVRAAPRAGGELARFSRAIPLPIALLVASGFWLAFVQLGGGLEALWTTSYGAVLMAKLAAVAVLFGLAAANRYWLVPKLESNGARGGRPLAISIALELALTILILALVALWRFTPPPRALATAAPITFHIHGEKAMAEIAIEREDGRSARLHVLDGAFQPLAAREVTLVLANPAAGIEPLRRSAVHTGDNTWRIDDLRIPVAGQWNLRVEILISDFEKVTIEDAVALPRSP
jgi:copper transport protein